MVGGQLVDEGLVERPEVALFDGSGTGEWPGTGRPVVDAVKRDGVNEVVVPTVGEEHVLLPPVGTELVGPHRFVTVAEGLTDRPDLAVGVVHDHVACLDAADVEVMSELCPVLGLSWCAHTAVVLFRLPGCSLVHPPMEPGRPGVEERLEALRGVVVEPTNSPGLCEVSADAVPEGGPVYVGALPVHIEAKPATGVGLVVVDIEGSSADTDCYLTGSGL